MLAKTNNNSLCRTNILTTQIANTHEMDATSLYHNKSDMSRLNLNAQLIHSISFHPCPLDVYVVYPLLCYVIKTRNNLLSRNGACRLFFSIRFEIQNHLIIIIRWWFLCVVDLRHLLIDYWRMDRNEPPREQTLSPIKHNIGLLGFICLLNRCRSQ